MSLPGGDKGWKCWLQGTLPPLKDEVTQVLLVKPDLPRSWDSAASLSQACRNDSLLLGGLELGEQMGCARQGRVFWRRELSKLYLERRLGHSTAADIHGGERQTPNSKPNPWVSF